jgi:hypothetical protein
MTLDYGAAGQAGLLRNLSGAASIGEFLWTVADEGRTVECLRRVKSGFVLEDQVNLDGLFPDLPGAADGDELDLEEVSIAEGRLWLCGSHCRVRVKPVDEQHLNAKVVRRPSRHFLGSIPLTRAGARGDGDAFALPPIGRNALRRALRSNAYLAPYLALPSKEGGLDIEGMLVRGSSAYLGLRGPVIDSVAVVVELALSQRLRKGVSVAHLHFLRLDGLGIRGMARWGRDILLIAGPVADSKTPFRMHRWRPRRADTIQEAETLLRWTELEKPEAICPLTNQSGQAGLLTLFDSPTDRRISGRRYKAEWRALSER